jgi:ferredoxin
MALRDIITIDEELCDGCGECVPSCVEGALQIINGKAKVVADVLCDGLGACVGECPTGALQVIQRDTVVFDEAAVAVHLGHAPAARPHPAVPAPANPTHAAIHHGGGCPSSRVQSFDDGVPAPQPAARPRIIPMQDRSPVAARPEPEPSPSGSRLRQWPVQLHLLPPTAPFLRNKDVLLAADCVAVAAPDFQGAFLDGRGLAIACPKLDQHQELYVEKLTAMIDEAGILSITVAIMEVPCCAGLLRLAEKAVAAATRKVPIHIVTLGIRGETR